MHAFTWRTARKTLVFPDVFSPRAKPPEVLYYTIVPDGVNQTRVIVADGLSDKNLRILTLHLARLSLIDLEVEIPGHILTCLNLAASKLRLAQ